jgi:hypothetical protein
VVAFLSAEWLRALDAEARQIAPPAGLEPGQRVIVGQEVHGVPGAAGGVVRYQLVVDGTGVRVEPDADEPAQLTFVCDYESAVALAQGETNAQAALMAGRLRLRGDVERFASARDALLALGDMFARTRAATTFDTFTP